MKGMEPNSPIRNRQVPGSSPGLGSRVSHPLRFDQFTFPFSEPAENSGTFGNTKPARFLVSTTMADAIRTGWDFQSGSSH
jgi:hypothetical protein